MTRVVIVGGGVVGLLTAVECVLAGAEVVVADQARLPNPCATSYDRHRVVRALHPGDPAGTRAAVAGARRWARLERMLGVRLHHRTGALTARRCDEVAPDMELLRASGVAATVLDTRQLVTRYPHVRVPAGQSAILEPDAGVLLADRALGALVGWLRTRPEVRFSLRRRVVEVDGDTATVRLAGGGRVHGDRIVVAAGPWSRSLLPAEATAGLALYRQSTLHCHVPDRLRDAWSQTPAIALPSTAARCWLVPPVAGTPLKLSAHSACRSVSEITDHATPPEWRAYLVELFSRVLLGLRGDWVHDARDAYYLADRASHGPRLLALDRGGAVVAYAACGGSSFKVAPLVARTLAARALDLAPPEPDAGAAALVASSPTTQGTTP